MATLRKDGDGGYVTPDGRWVVEPVTMGAGVNNNRGWSNGRRAWRVTDTTGAARLGIGGSTAVRDRLWEVRDLIDDFERAGA